MSNEITVTELRQLADRLDGQARISTRPGQLQELERIAARLRVFANTAEDLNSELHLCDRPLADPLNPPRGRDWTCDICGLRWVYVRRMINRKMLGKWEQK